VPPAVQEPVPVHASDEDLLIHMSLCESEPANARAAWRIFYERHVRYVHGHCYEVLAGRLEGRYDRKAIWEMGADLAEDVLIRVYERAETYKLRGSRDPTQMRYQVRGWLGTIAKNIVCDWLTNRGHESGSRFIDDLPEDTPIDDPDPPTPLQECVGKLLDALPEKERRVLLASMDFFDTTTGRSRLSTKEASNLAQELGMTTASLRQVRRRALKRLKEEITSKCPGLRSERPR
jgi:RNA polymerase sigma factor (sigma-70 family)